MSDSDGSTSCRKMIHEPTHQDSDDPGSRFLRLAA
jgi:hypothetical protein